VPAGHTQTLLWISSTRALDYTANQTVGDSVYRPLFFVTLGLAFLALTDSVAANAWVVEQQYGKVVLSPSPPPAADLDTDVALLDESVVVDGSEADFGDSTANNADDEGAKSRATHGIDADSYRIGGDSSFASTDDIDEISRLDSITPVVADGGWLEGLNHATLKFYAVSSFSLLGQMIFVCVTHAPTRLVWWWCVMVVYGWWWVVFGVFVFVCVWRGGGT
jgi:hypothetical protein